MSAIQKLKINAISMVTKENLQRINIEYDCAHTVHLRLTVLKNETVIVNDVSVAFDSGIGKANLLLPVQEESFDALWRFTDQNDSVIYEVVSTWKKPIPRTFYLMISSHTDIGLHNSQYIQRANSVKFIDKAINLCEETNHLDLLNQYRYTIEGTWVWNNYYMEKGYEKAKDVAENAIKTGKIGICSAVAGNHIQTYGLEEMCRSTYERKRLSESWGINSKTLSMIDNNGLPMSMIQAYTDAGYQNILFSPNHWNPLPSTIWEMNRRYFGCQWSPEANGGGSRIDIRYSSNLPMVFYWEDDNENRLLVWASPQYDNGGEEFGLYHQTPIDKNTIPVMEQRMAEKLPLLDEKYPYSVWLMACYGDDESPNTNLLDQIQAWNQKWSFPQLRTLGNPDEPFAVLKEKHHDQIPVIKGDITGGWYQHPISAPELLAKKFEADRLLPTAEKWSVIAGLLDKNYSYPATEFRRAWDSLLLNDEHSYGTSGYQGRRVYETWMQHKDWIEKATKTAQKELSNALNSISSSIASTEHATVVFNQTLQHRTELIEKENRYALVSVPPMGYTVVSDDSFFENNAITTKSDTPPEIENIFYKVSFAKNGTIQSIFDKELGKELLDKSSQYNANEMLYTYDNHKTFYSPEQAEFEVKTEEQKITVTIKTTHQSLKCEIIQKIVLFRFEKRIDIDNQIYHAKDMINNNRYYRYLYFSFPFMVENAKRLCHLNGNVAEYAKDVTGHGTDVYMAANEWCCCQNENFGIALMMLDSQLVEFDHIHPDKTDFANTGKGSQIFSYVANDWLQMHSPGGSHLNFRFRFSITSYKNNHWEETLLQMAERYANPVFIKEIPPQKGYCKESSKSFMNIDTKLRLLTLKRADDGKGVIARCYGNQEDFPVKDLAGMTVYTERNTIDEYPCTNKKTKGFITYRLGAENITLSERKAEDIPCNHSVPAPIGSVYTGLISKPCAACGEKPGHLYLLWGHNTEPDFSHYNLYRSETANFEVNESTFIAKIFPEEYVVGRYEDTGLKEHTCYYYKVCAVNKEGVHGEISEEFHAYTKETI